MVNRRYVVGSTPFPNWKTGSNETIAYLHGLLWSWGLPRSRRGRQVEVINEVRRADEQGSISLRDTT